MANKRRKLKGFDKEFILAQLLYEVVKVRQSTTNEVSLHIPQGFLRRDSWDIVARPSFSQHSPELEEIRVPLAHRKFPLQVISLDLVSDVIVAFHRLLDWELLPSRIARHRHHLSCIVLHYIDISASHLLILHLILTLILILLLLFFIVAISTFTLWFNDVRDHHIKLSGILSTTLCRISIVLLPLSTCTRALTYKYLLLLLLLLRGLLVTCFARRRISGAWLYNDLRLIHLFW